MNLHIFNFEIFKNPQKSQKKITKTFTKKFTKTIDKKTKISGNGSTSGARKVPLIEYLERICSRTP